jgi:cell division protein FtsB
MRNVRRRQVEDSRKKKRLIYLTFGIMLVIYLTLNVIIGENGLLKYLKLKSIKNRLMAETSAYENQNEDARTHIESLKKDPDLVEEHAREYGLTKEGELIFKFEDQE